LGAFPNDRFDWEQKLKVGGHLAVNFSSHNCFIKLTLIHILKVGGQMVRMLGRTEMGT
jgi:hypothetical protein